MTNTQSPAQVQEAEEIEPSEVESVIACLGDDAAQLREENPEDERAANMERAAELLQELASRTPAPGLAGGVVTNLPAGWTAKKTRRNGFWIESPKATVGTENSAELFPFTSKIDKLFVRLLEAIESAPHPSPAPQAAGAPQGVTDAEVVIALRETPFGAVPSTRDWMRRALEAFAQSRQPSPAQAEPKDTIPGWMHYSSRVGNLVVDENGHHMRDRQFSITDMQHGNAFVMPRGEYDLYAYPAGEQPVQFATGAAEGAEPTADAERMDWLEEQNGSLEPETWVVTSMDYTDAEGPARYWVGANLRAAIDAARAAQNATPPVASSADAIEQGLPPL